MSSHDDPSGLHPEEPLQKLERSSLNIIIGSGEGPSTRVPPSSEVDRGKESHGIQPESDREKKTDEKEKSGLKVIGIVPDRGKDEQSVEVQDLGASNVESKHPFWKILEDVGKAGTCPPAESQGSHITNPHEKPETQLGVQISHNKPKQKKTLRKTLRKTKHNKKI